MNTIDRNRIELGLKCHAEVTGVGGPFARVAGIRSSRRQNEQTRKYRRDRWFATPAPAHVPELQLQEDHGEYHQRPVPESRVADLERKHGGIQLARIRLPRGDDTDVLAVLCERMQDREHVGDDTRGLVTDSDGVEVRNGGNVLKPREDAFAGDIFDNAKVDCGAAQTVVLVLHNEDTFAAYWNVLTVLRMPCFLRHIDFEVCLEVADIDDAEVVFLDDAAMCSTRQRQQTQRQQYHSGKRQAAGRHRKHARYSRPSGIVGNTDFA